MPYAAPPMTADDQEQMVASEVRQLFVEIPTVQEIVAYQDSPEASRLKSVQHQTVEQIVDVPVPKTVDEIVHAAPPMMAAPIISA